MYNEAYEISRIFINDLINEDYLPIFDPIFEKLKTDTTMYEIKITIIERLIPSMSNTQAEIFMKIIDDILDEPAENSIFRNNINPLRLGLQLYHTISEVHRKSGFSEYITNSIKDNINR